MYTTSSQFLRPLGNLAERKTKTLTLYIVTEVVDFKVFRSLLKLKVKNPLFVASSFLAKKDLKADD